jgi:DNA-binding NarL/FixJ family response regulator
VVVQVVIDELPEIAVLLVDDQDLVRSGLRRILRRKDGFVLKDSSAEELIRAVRAVARGDSYLDPAVTSRVLTTYRKAADGPRGNDIAELTSRELDVLTLIGKGLSNTEIADELCISGVTVKSHIGRIFLKLDLRDRAAAIVYAYDNGIVAPR